MPVSAQTLAQDVLLGIFFIVESHDVPADQDLPYTGTTASAKQKDLWAVSQVCRHWRDIALHSQILWSRIIIHPSYLSSSDPLEIIRTKLKRSGSSPLTVSIRLGWEEYSASGSDPKPCLIREMIAPLVATSERWVLLSLSSFAAGDLMSLFEAATDRLPSLRSLHFFVASRSSSPRIDSMFSLAPSLREVTSLSWAGLDFDLPFQQLRIFRTAIKPSAFNALTQMQSLHSLHLHFQTDVDIPSTTVHLPKLEKMVCEAHTLEFVRALSCPKLISFHCRIGDLIGGEDTEIAGLKEFQHRSQFRLKYLEVRYTDAIMRNNGSSPFEWADTSSIETLLLIRNNYPILNAPASNQEESTWEIKLFGYLTLDHDAATAYRMPLLTTFRISTSTEGDARWKVTLYQMVRSRPLLKSLHVAYGGPKRHKCLELTNFKEFCNDLGAPLT